jgi:site-specific DNA-methyltransferase (adenine-specific)
MHNNIPACRLLVGDNRDLIKTLADNSVDAIVTDPPYGLADAKNLDVREMLRHWLDGGEVGVKGAGFMNRKWDASVPQPPIWAQCLRVLKPGGHLLAFGGTRTYDLVVLGLRLAGFEIRDQLQWVYGCGMNKVGYVKTEDGRHIMPGWGGALRPGHEPIVVARKPVDGTLAANLTTWSTGGFNIDACRTESDEGDGPSRWPTNFIHDGSPEVLAAFPEAPGQLAPTRGDHAPMNNAIYGAMRHGTVSKPPRRDATLSAARFFYCPKASPRDRSEGLAEKNPHVTVKPVALMRYLCRLVTPEGGTVLDPFAGSGSTGKAAALEGFGFLGFELDPEYAAVAKARIEHAVRSRANQPPALDFGAKLSAAA